MTEEVQTPKIENTETAAPVQENTTPQVEEQPVIKSESNQANWRKFREEREKDRKARLEAEKIAEQKKAEAEALKAAMETLLVKPVHIPEPAFHVESNGEDVIEKKIQMALEKERQKYENEQRQREQQQLPQKLEQTYRDFNQVCSTENLDYLEYHYPEVASAFKYMPDGFEKWSSIYQSVKRFVPQGHKEDQKRIEQNMMKPQTSSPSLTDTKPEGSSWKLTEERKRANWERMQRERKSF